WQARVSYAIGYARGNSEANQTNDNNFQVLGDPMLDRNFGPLDADRRQNLTVSGRVELPKTGGLTLSGVYRYLSGAPMSLYNSNIDADRNGRLFDIFNTANFANPGQVAFGSDQRLPDFLVLTALRGGNGQPRAAQFSVRFGFCSTT